ncbi:MAG: hypothetical protein QUS13_09460, partial [Smithella sp.]|nr:hypothetical protein [Smithella sp.]
GCPTIAGYTRKKATANDFKNSLHAISNRLPVFSSPFPVLLGKFLLLQRFLCRIRYAFAAI